MKRKKKYKLPEGLFVFDPQVYPIRLYAAVCPTLEPIVSYFTNVRTGKPAKEEWLPTTDGYLIYEITDPNNWPSFLIAIKNKDCITPGFIAHEATHAAEQIWKYLAEEHPSSESNAYLVEWIVNSVYSML